MVLSIFSAHVCIMAIACYVSEIAIEPVLGHCRLGREAS